MARHETFVLLRLRRLKSIPCCAPFTVCMDLAGGQGPLHFGACAVAFCCGLLWRPAPAPVHLVCSAGEAVELQPASTFRWIGELAIAVILGLLAGLLKSIWHRRAVIPRALFDS